MEGAAVYQGKVHVKLCLEGGLGAMVAWSWSELAVNGIKDSPKKESEILIKMFHIIMSYYSLLLIKRKWMVNIVFLKATHPFFPIKEGSTSTPFSSSQGGNITGLRCSELLSSKDEGPKRSIPDYARWDLRGTIIYDKEITVYS